MMKLLHLHLPKTGGTALRRFFVDQLGEDAVTPPLQGMMLSEALLRWDRAAVISGHFIARQGDNIPAERPAITVLRNPVDRLLSEYFYNKFDVDNLPVDAGQRAGNLDTYIAYLTRPSAEAPTTQIEMLYPLGTDKQTRLSMNEKLAASMAAIDQFALVGVQEEMDDFCSMLCAKFHWKSMVANQLNVTSRRVQSSGLTPSQRHAIEALLEPEITLYLHALSRFKKDRRSFISSANVTEASLSSTSVSDKEAQGLSPLRQKVKQDFGDRGCEIDAVEVIGRLSGPGQAMTGEIIDILFHITAHQTFDQVNAGIAIKDEHGLLAFGTNSLLLGEIYSLTAGKYVIKFTTLNRLGPGVYFIDTALTPASSHYDGCFHWRHAAASLNVIAYATQHFEGNVLLDVDISIDSISENAVWCRKLPALKNNAARAFGNSSKYLTTFCSSIDLMSFVDQAERDSDILLQVKITNQGKEAWSSNGRYPVKLSYRWHTPDGSIVIADGVRSDLPGNIAAGASTQACMHVRTPNKPGILYLTISLVQEHVAWFTDQDSANGRVLRVTVV